MAAQVNVTCFARIRWEKLYFAANDEVKITLHSEEAIQCDHVIVTVSVGILKEECSSMFNPPIHSTDPRKQQAIKDVGKT